MSVAWGRRETGHNSETPDDVTRGIALMEGLVGHRAPHAWVLSAELAAGGWSFPRNAAENQDVSPPLRQQV